MADPTQAEALAIQLAEAFDYDHSDQHDEDFYGTIQCVAGIVERALAAAEQRGAERMRARVAQLVSDNYDDGDSAARIILALPLEEPKP